MKKLLVSLCVAGLIVFSGSLLFAGGIENKHNWSAEYIRTLNRNAATDSADAVVYNPAGVMKMEDGLYLKLDGQYVLKEYSNAVAGIEYETDEPDFIPSLFTLYKKDKWAAYGAVAVVVAGGQVDFKDGDATTFGLARGIMAVSPFDTLIDHRLKGESYFIGYTLGGAYEINDMVSVSLGARYVDAGREFKGHATLGVGAAPGVFDTTYRVDYEETGDGWGGIIGVNIAPTDKLNIGLRYETKTSIDLKTDVKTDTVPGGLPGLVDGSERNRDMPPLLGLGVSYKINPKIKVDANFTWYLNNDVNWDDNPVTLNDESRKDNGNDLGIAFEYTFNSKWKASVGYMYTWVGIEPENMKIETPELDGGTIAGGFAYKPTPDLELNFGILQVFYNDKTTDSGIKYEKDPVIDIAAGIQYKFF
ncbi:MAG: outer membrane protein transport protein [Deltaproteobacteria bacterium]|nr:outer membrane protein transport protein [Deltaproteobacteria bacterium]